MTSRKPASLGADLIVKKGEAAPALTVPQEKVATDTVQAKPAKTPLAETTAVTLRLDRERYKRLKMFGVDNRMTNQDILVAALDAYLSANT